MLDLNKILIDGGSLTAIFLAIVYLIGRTKPRMFLTPNDIPADILTAVPAQTAEEKRLGKVAALPLMLILTAGTFYSAYTYFLQSSAGFLLLFLHSLAILAMISLGDLILMDWIILNTITPKWAVFPGTEGFAGYKDYGFHGRAHLKAAPLLLFGAAISAGLVVLASLLL